MNLGLILYVINLVSVMLTNLCLILATCNCFKTTLVSEHSPLEELSLSDWSPVLQVWIWLLHIQSNNILSSSLVKSNLVKIGDQLYSDPPPYGEYSSALVNAISTLKDSLFSKKAFSAAS